MKEVVLVLLNLLLLSAIILFAYTEHLDNITGAVVGLEKGVLVKYIVYYNTTDLTTHESYRQFVRNRTVFFVDHVYNLTMQRLNKLSENQLYSVDVDSSSDVCTYHTYLTKVYRFDANNDSIFASNEPIVFSSVTDDDGCVAAILPDENYQLILA